MKHESFTHFSDTISRRFPPLGIENSAENRRQFRQLIFSADDSFANHVSGVILHCETLYQKADDGTPLVQVLANKVSWATGTESN